MRSDLHESGIKIGETGGNAASLAVALEPSAVDAALGDETTSIVTLPTGRREIRNGAASDAARMTIDHPHAGASPGSAEPGDGALLRQLSRQLGLLEIQQTQIRRLLEATERRAGRATTT